MALVPENQHGDNLESFESLLEALTLTPSENLTIPDTVELPTSQDTTSTHDAPLVVPLAHLETRNTQRAMKNIPVEVWDQIFAYLYPSQLIKVSFVNRHLHSMIASSRTWTDMYHRAFPGGTLALIPNLEPESRSYMLYMCAASFQVCEQCFRVCDGSYHRARLAAMPLKVYLDWADDKIKLCLKCRQDRFAEYPEPVPKGILNGQRILSADARKIYSLGKNEVKRLSLFYSRKRGHTRSQQEALEMARGLYGGDVGIQARPRSLSRPLQKCFHRLDIYRRRRQLVLRGGTWYPAEICIWSESKNGQSCSGLEE